MTWLDQLFSNLQGVPDQASTFSKRVAIPLDWFVIFAKLKKSSEKVLA